MSKPLVCVADDDQQLLKMMDHCLRLWGYRSAGASDRAQLFEHLAREQPAMLLLDQRFGADDGIEVLQDVLRDYPDLAIVIMTGQGSIDSAVQAIKLGAYDYLTKPPDLERLQVMLRLRGHFADLAQL